MDWRDMARQRRNGEHGSGADWSGSTRLCRHGEARNGLAKRGEARFGRWGKSQLGAKNHGKAGLALQVAAQQGEARQALNGPAMPGRGPCEVWQCRLGVARHVRVRPGEDCSGEAG
jgi:hypothetical protein